MGRLIKGFADGRILEFDRGGIDNWCVYEVNANGMRTAPKDRDYFGSLARFAATYGANKVYEDFVRVYNQTTAFLDRDVLNDISEIAQTYPDDVIQADVTFTTLYAGMIAEEQRANTRLGKRIKRLGVHSLLIERQPIGYATNFMRGMNWRQIDAECNYRGF